MKSHFRWTIVIALPLFLCAKLLGQGPADRMSQLAEATSINREGIKPWHIRMNFNLYDLNGKKSESGVLEEWWASPNSFRIIVTSPSFKGVNPLAAGTDEKLLRPAYLIDQLLRLVVSPMPSFKNTASVMIEENSQTFNKVTLSCFATATAAAADSAESHQNPLAGPKYCFEPGKDILRIYFDNSEGLSVVRNRLGRFQGVSVALDNAISFNGKPAIDGSVDTIEGFDPSKSTELLASHSDEPKTVPGIVVSGRRLKVYRPDFPVAAKIHHLSGTVILCGVVTKQGTVRSLAVVASPDPSFSSSAMNAVGAWTYQPFLLNGKPVEVRTTFTIHYNIN